MDFTLTTPALFVFGNFITAAGVHQPLSYTSRIDQGVMRQAAKNSGKYLIGQIENLRKRIYLIRQMQLFGV